MGNDDVTGANSRLVVDANVFVHGYVNPEAKRIRSLLANWDQAAVVFQVPGLWRYEVTNALYRNVKAGSTTAERGVRLLRKILSLPVELHDDPVLHEEATEIALRLNAGAAYDAHYLALAERLGLPFYTADAKLHAPASKLFPTIEFVPVE